MPPLENMASPSFAGFPPCAVCAASYAKNGAIGFKRDNAQFNHAALYPLNTGRVFVPFSRFGAYPWLQGYGKHTTQDVFSFPLTAKGRMLALYVWGLCGAYGQGLALLACLFLFVYLLSFLWGNRGTTYRIHQHGKRRMIFWIKKEKRIILWLSCKKSFFKESPQTRLGPRFHRLACAASPQEG